MMQGLTQNSYSIFQIYMTDYQNNHGGQGMPPMGGMQIPNGQGMPPMGGMQGPGAPGMPGMPGMPPMGGAGNDNIAVSSDALQNNDAGAANNVPNFSAWQLPGADQAAPQVQAPSFADIAGGNSGVTSWQLPGADQVRPQG